MTNATARRYSTPDTGPELRSGAEPRSGRTARPGLPAAASQVPLADLPDEKLFARYQEGDERAFDLIVERYQPLIQGFLFKRLKDEERVQDLTQDTFLRVHRARARYDSGRKFSTWIYTIASNLLKNEYRNQARRREKSFSELRKDSSSADSRPIEFESGDPDPEQITYRRELKTAIDETIERMEEHHRIPFVMREVEDRSYEEIAGAIGIPVGTVKSRLFRARTAFQGLFAVPI